MVVATPNSTHVPLALAALAAGQAVVVDKPFAPTAEEARRVVAEARRRGLFLSVYHQRRWDSDTLTLRRLIAEGALGDVLRFESRFERWRPVPKGGWRESDAPGGAGGLLYDLGSHLVDSGAAPVRAGGARVCRSSTGGAPGSPWTTTCSGAHARLRRPLASLGERPGRAASARACARWAHAPPT